MTPTRLYEMGDVIKWHDDELLVLDISYDYCAGVVRMFSKQRRKVVATTCSNLQLNSKLIKHVDIFEEKNDDPNKTV